VPDLSLAPLARQDLKEIGRYSQQTWGAVQRDRYLRQTRDIVEHLRTGAISGRSCPDIREGLRCHPCNRQFIFFRRSAGGDVEILRILHERMGFNRHL